MIITISSSSSSTELGPRPTGQPTHLPMIQVPPMRTPVPVFDYTLLRCPSYRSKALSSFVFFGFLSAARHLQQPYNNISTTSPSICTSRHTLSFLFPFLLHFYFSPFRTSNFWLHLSLYFIFLSLTTPTFPFSRKFLQFTHFFLFYSFCFSLISATTLYQFVSLQLLFSLITFLIYFAFFHFPPLSRFLHLIDLFL